MSLLKNDIISALQNHPTLGRDYPWYPTAYLANTDKENNLQKLAAFVNHPLRLHLLVSAEETALEIPELVSANETPEIEEIETAQVEVAAEENLFAAEALSNEVTKETEEPIIEVAAAPVENVREEKGEIPLVMPAISLPTTTDESFLFQPFHTVDYFASQGIKADQSAITTTRFDTQLKSFTQWLKTMKRADYQTGQFSADPAVDAQAKASLEVKEVLTEAMADVLAQQGRHVQAIEVYRKLTLLHPEKSAFFAAQIEKLKA